jgi:hypothetical protein
VDPDHDGNQYSFYFPSRLDFHLAGGARFRCENLRAGCSGLARDCEPVPFSYLALSLSPDKPRADANCALKGRSGRSCLPRHLRLSSRGIGPARLGRSLRAFRRHWRSCVRGGGRFVVRGRHGRITFVASSARGHRSPRLAPGRRPRARHARRVRGHVFRVGRIVYGVRRGKVRFVGASRDRRAVLLRRVRAF